MNAYLNTVWLWLKAKFGRITTGLGVILQGMETLDISIIKDPLESFLGHRGVQGIIVGLFAASFIRHQMVANKHPIPKPADDGK